MAVTGDQTAAGGGTGRAGGVGTPGVGGGFGGNRSDNYGGNPRDGTEGGRGRKRRFGSGGLPRGLEDFLLSNGLSLDAFRAFRKGDKPKPGEGKARLMERRAAANRLGQSKTLLSKIDGGANVRRPTLLEG